MFLNPSAPRAFGTSRLHPGFSMAQLGTPLLVLLCWGEQEAAPNCESRSVECLLSGPRVFMALSGGE